MPLFAQAPLIEMGRAAMSRGDTDTAINILEKAVAQSPKSAESHFVLGNAYGNKAQTSGMFTAARYGPKAREEWERAVALDPKHVEARFRLVQFYAMAPGFMGGSDDKAFAQAKEIRTIDPILGHRACALIYAQQNKHDLAKKELLDAIREQPDSPKAHTYLGQRLANFEKNYAAAFAQFETALKLDPGYMPAFYHLGRTAALAGTNLPRGEEALKKYLAYIPAENEPALADAHYFLGAIYEKEGKAAEAKQCYRTALRLNPTLRDAPESK